MRKKYLQFVIRLTILSLILGLLAFILSRFLPGGMISPALPYLFILFYVITALVHYILLRISALNPRKFVSYFMLATFLKLMNYLIVVVVYAFYVKEGILPFILSFFILYIFYTVFEVVTILAQTKE
ncbi:MAG: hypothetical protein M0Q51_10440 [Bacteroidales bacterium]|nr:hypothetical protein [Bacteroidales bacterium]